MGTVIWTPRFDILDSVGTTDYFKNSELTFHPIKKEVHLMIPNIVVKVLCQNMDFSQFPFDTQKCDIALKASSNKINFAQSEDENLNSNNSNSGEFEIYVKYLNETEIEERFEESQYSRIGFTINLERKSTMYILSYYLPSGLIVLLVTLR